MKENEKMQKAYYRYAPPMGEWLNSDKRPQKPFENAKPHQCSVYYFWWAYLRENVDYIACCKHGGTGPMARIYADFGDLRKNDFEKWWTSVGRKLFREPLQGQVQIYRNVPMWFDRRTHVLVGVPFTGDIDRTISDLRYMLGDIFRKEKERQAEMKLWQGKRTIRRQNRPKRVARYQVHTKPVIKTLWQRLEVWKEVNKTPSADKFEIGKRVGLISPTDLMRAKSSKKIEVSYVKNEVRTLVNRYYREAAALIANAGLGQFPDMRVIAPKNQIRQARIKKPRMIKLSSRTKKNPR